MVFGTFGETNTHVKMVLDMAVEYGVQHLGRTMLATIVEAVKSALQRRYMTQMTVPGWRGYANLILDR